MNYFKCVFFFVLLLVYLSASSPIKHGSNTLEANNTLVFEDKVTPSTEILQNVSSYDVPGQQQRYPRHQIKPKNKDGEQSLNRKNGYEKSPKISDEDSVSYTHLTLPTIYSV